MNATTTTRRITRRIATAVAGPAVIAGLLGGALALGAPAQAAPPNDKATCSTAPVTAAGPGMSSVLTRAGQLNASQGTQQSVGATSCVGH